MLSVYGTILRPDQFAGLMLNAWPFAPTLSGLRSSLQLLRARRGVQAAGSGGAGGSGSGGGSVGERREGSGGAWWCE